MYIWHALTGYWGGLLPDSEALERYSPKFVLPSKIFDFYNDLHGYLASCGIDGVKVDVQNIVETVGADYGGCVALISHYQEALEKSVMRNFKSNNLICSMSISMSNDYLYRFD